MSKAINQAIQPPIGILSPPFSPDTKVRIGSGYDYTDEEKSVHGIESHQAVDFDVPTGTPVLAVADGLAVATYSEYQLRNEDGSPYLYRDKPMWFGSGYIVQILHRLKLQNRTLTFYTQYVHLNKIHFRIPYFRPEEDKNGDLTPGRIKGAKYDVLRMPIREYGKRVKAYPIKQGELVGWSGMTGCGYGRRCYEDLMRGWPYSTKFDPHLHFMVFSRRAARGRKPFVIWDPFGLYGNNPNKYPAKIDQWHVRRPNAKHDPFWRPA